MHFIMYTFYIFLLIFMTVGLVGAYRTVMVEVFPVR